MCCSRARCSHLSNSKQNTGHLPSLAGINRPCGGGFSGYPYARCVGTIGFEEKSAPRALFINIRALCHVCFQVLLGRCFQLGDTANSALLLLIHCFPTCVSLSELVTPPSFIRTCPPLIQPQACICCDSWRWHGFKHRWHCCWKVQQQRACHLLLFITLPLDLCSLDRLGAGGHDGRQALVV